jgi:hypothetical protein
MNIKVEVVFFDRRDGEGLVRCLSSRNVAPIYACNIPGKKTWYAETACVYYNEGDIVEVTQDEETGFIIGVTPGIFDENKWASLDQNKLAFKCDQNGDAINGLFR